MRIVTAETMRLIDQRVTQDHRVPVAVLMERAGQAVSDEIMSHLSVRPSSFVTRPSPSTVTIFCGRGHNGGDGLVAARVLRGRQVPVTVVLMGAAKDLKGEPARQWKKWKKLKGDSVEWLSPRDAERIHAFVQKADVVVDALVGTGARLPLAGVFAEAVSAMQVAKGLILAVDIPSGLHPDTGLVEGPCVQAHRTIALGAPKIGCFLGRGPEQTGRVVVKDIGFPPAAFDDAPGEGEWADAEHVGPLLPRRKGVVHKGTAGKVLVVGGSSAYTGAPILASWGALRAGCGLAVAAVPASLVSIVQSHHPEVIALGVPDGGAGVLSIREEPVLKAAAETCQAVVLGPGCGRHPETMELVKHMIATWSLPMVVDADALYALAEDPGAWLRATHRERMILTPHEGEMARLLSIKASELHQHRWTSAVEFAKQHKAHVVLKGPHTLVVSPLGDVSVNSTGHSGMASGGTGDVLSGVIGSLLAQGASARNAAIAGVFVHGLAAEMAAAQLGGAIGLTAGDVAESLPRALAHLRTI